MFQSTPSPFPCCYVCKTVFHPIEIHLLTKWFSVFQSTKETRISFSWNLIARTWRCRKEHLCRKMLTRFKRIEFQVKCSYCSSVVTDQLQLSLFDSELNSSLKLKYSKIQAYVKRTGSCPDLTVHRFITLYLIQISSLIELKTTFMEEGCYHQIYWSSAYACISRFVYALVVSCMPQRLNCSLASCHRWVPSSVLSIFFFFRLCFKTVLLFISK